MGHWNISVKLVVIPFYSNTTFVRLLNARVLGTERARAAETDDATVLTMLALLPGGKLSG